MVNVTSTCIFSLQCGALRQVFTYMYLWYSVNNVLMWRQWYADVRMSVTSWCDVSDMVMWRQWHAVLQQSATTEASLSRVVATLYENLVQSNSKHLTVRYCQLPVQIAYWYLTFAVVQFSMLFVLHNGYACTHTTYKQDKNTFRMAVSTHWACWVSSTQLQSSRWPGAAHTSPPWRHSPPLPRAGHLPLRFRAVRITVASLHLSACWRHQRKCLTQASIKSCWN